MVSPGARNTKAPKLAKGHHSEKEKGEERAETGTEMNCTQEFFEMQSEKENWDGRADEPNTTILTCTQGYFLMSPMKEGEKETNLTQSYSILFSKKYIGFKILLALLAPTGALYVMVHYHKRSVGNFARFSLSPRHRTTVVARNC